MDHSVPGEAGIVDDDMDFAVAKFGGFLDEVLVVSWVDDVAGDGDGGAAGIIDGIGDGLSLGWKES